MRQHRTDKFANMPWHVRVAAEDVPESGERFALAADARMREEIARVAGLRELPRLEADFEVTRQGVGGLHVRGRVSATVGQNCVVTLEPLANAIEEEVDVLFVPQPAAVPANGDDAASDRTNLAGDQPEPLIDGAIDLGVLATEFLILGIDPYPRKPGAVFEAPAELDRDAGPFAALSEWTKGRNDH